MKFDLWWPKTCVIHITSKGNIPVFHIPVLHRSTKNCLVQIPILNLSHIESEGHHTSTYLITQKYPHKISATQKKQVLFSDFFFFFSNSTDILFFSTCGGVHKSGDEKLVTLYDRNLKLDSIMSFWVHHSKRNLDDKIRHRI